MAAASIGTMIFMTIDPRVIDGDASVWTKPLKFELALALHAAPLGFAPRLLSPPDRHGSVMLTVAVAFLAACIAEMGYLLLQGGRGEQSHVNVARPYHRAMHSMMAFAAVITIGAAGASAQGGDRLRVCRWDDPDVDHRFHNRRTHEPRHWRHSGFWRSHDADGLISNQRRSARLTRLRNAHGPGRTLRWSVDWPADAGSYRCRQRPGVFDTVGNPDHP